MVPAVTKLYEVNQRKLTLCDRILPNSLSYIFMDSWPVAALAWVPVDEARLAALQVGDSLEALEVCALVSCVLIQAIRAATAEVCQGVSGGGGSWGGGGLWGEACRIKHGKIETLILGKNLQTAIFRERFLLINQFISKKVKVITVSGVGSVSRLNYGIYPLSSSGGWWEGKFQLSRRIHQSHPCP